MKATLKEKWNECLNIIRDNIGEIRTETWFACAKPLSYENDTLKLGLPSHFFYEKYEDDFIGLLSSVLKKVFGENVCLDYEVKMTSEKDSAVTLKSQQPSQPLKNKLTKSQQTSISQLGQTEVSKSEFDSQLNETLTFENYCVGESNRLPVTIAEYIANQPGRNDFNPFFLYGDVGVGKTHLIQAIGIRVKERNPQAKVLFVPMRQFQNLVANATIQKKIPGFLNWFQQMDVLLIDDLQELSNNDGTAKQLFPIFNYLHQNGKALIFTCDRPPVELDGITDRLIDRFKWGVTEQLHKPDYALKKKILKFKAERNGLNLSDEIISLIAERSTGSVRELEGIVMGILTRSIALNMPITLALAQDVMKHSIKQTIKKTINFDMIVESTAEYYRLNPDVIFSSSRTRDIADARQIIMYLSHKLTNLSSSSIGNKLNRSHATVLHGIGAVKDRLPLCKDLSSAVDAIESELHR